MSSPLPLILSAITGTLLGLVFFQGLWITVRRLEQTRHPIVWMLGSLLLRFGLVLAGFFLLARQGDWTLLLAAVAGFTLARLLITRQRRPADLKAERSKP